MASKRMMLRLLAVLVLCGHTVSYKPRMPEQDVYRWNDRESNRDRTQALIDWAEGRKPSQNQWLPKLEMTAQDQPTENFLEVSDHHTASETSAQEMRLKSWRHRFKERAGAEEETKNRRTARRTAIVALQVAMAQGHDRKAADVDLQNAARHAGGEHILKHAKKVAGLIKGAARYFEEQSRAGDPEMAEALLETQSSSSRSKSSRKKVSADADLEEGLGEGDWDAAPGNCKKSTWMTCGKDGDCKSDPSNPCQGVCLCNKKVAYVNKCKCSAGGPGGPAKPNFQTKNSRCIMCLFLMEMTERDIGFPQRDFYSDAYPSYSSRQTNGSPGPASYMRNFGGSVSQPPGSYNPIPGPGYSFLEQSERLSAAAKANAKARSPVGAWTNYGDFSTLSSPDQNLHARLVEERAAESAHSQEVRQPAPAIVPTDMFSMYESAFESNSGAGSNPQGKQSASALASARLLNSGDFMALLQTEESDAAGGRGNLRTDKADARLQGPSVNGAASALGLTICRPGKKYCRPRLKQPGRRQLERTVQIQSVKTEYGEMQGLMARSLSDTCGDMPMSFSFLCSTFSSSLGTIAQQYLHDYDDNEICSDLGMCTYKMLKAPQKPYVYPYPSVYST